MLVLFVCLFVPVVYRVQGAKHGQDISGVGRVWWLFVSARVSGNNKDKSANVQIRILGIPLAVYQKVGSVIGKVCQAIAKAFKKVVSLFERKVKTDVEKETTVIKKETAKAIEAIADKEVKNQSEDITLINAKAEKTKANGDEDVSKTAKSEDGLWQRIKVILAKIYYFPQWLYEKVRKIHLTIRELCGKIKQWREFLTSDTFKTALRFVLNRGNELRKRILPRKIKGNIIFGFDDPSITGQTLAVASIITPLYKGKLTITPMFDQKIIEGDILMKGRIFGITLVKIAWSVYRNKDVKGVIHHFSQKEA